jgi:D-alanyl-D-alanine dipeptidase
MTAREPHVRARRAFRFAKQINTEAETNRTLLDQALETNGFGTADKPKPRGKKKP